MSTTVRRKGPTDPSGSLDCSRDALRGFTVVRTTLTDLEATLNANRQHEFVTIVPDGTHCVRVVYRA